MFVITASGDLFGFGHASMSPPPALSRGERELVAPATLGQYNALQREWGAKRPGHIAQVEQ